MKRTRRRTDLVVPLLVALSAHALMGVAGHRLLARRAAWMHIAPRVVPGPIVLQVQVSPWDDEAERAVHEPAVQPRRPTPLVDEYVLPAPEPETPTVRQEMSVLVPRPVLDVATSEAQTINPRPSFPVPEISLPAPPPLELDMSAMEEDPAPRLPDIAAEVLGETAISPRYPMSSRMRGEEGTVIIRASVDSGGRARDVQVDESSGHAELDRSAVRAVRDARFEIPDDFPGRCEVRIPITFRLRDG
jgi:protein TonB